MNLIVDGAIYELQARGGISRVFSEILPRMCRLDDSLRISLLLTGRRRQTLPYHPHIHAAVFPFPTRLLKPGFLWRPLVKGLQKRWQRSVIGTTEGKIWHSTYYTLPDDAWQGKTVVTVADLASELFPDTFSGPGEEAFRNHKRTCITGADEVICISESTRQDVLRYYRIDRDKTRTVLLACGETFRQSGAAAPGQLSIPQPFLLYVGSRAHYKNFRLLLESYAEWQHRREVNLVVVGGKWSDDEATFLSRLGIAGQAYLLDNADDETLCALYNAAAALVYPSLYEGFGIPLLEAMACGCPVVASRIPSTVEVAGDCAVYFGPGEKEGLVAALDQVLAEGKDSPRVRLGLERVKSFSWEKTAAQTLEVYRSLASG